MTEMQKKVRDQALKTASKGETHKETDKQIDSAIVAEANRDQSCFKLVKASTVTKDIFPPTWAIDEFLPAEGLAEFFGASGSLKSFVVLDICFAIATGLKWHGRDVKQGSVTYIVGEGGAGIRKRLRALELEHGVEDYPLYISEKPMDLANPQSCQDVADSIKENVGKSAMIAIDTLHRNSTGSEDSSDDFANILHNIDTTFRGVTNIVAWVHHTGHGESKRSRGSSSRFGALDMSYLIERGSEDTSIVTITNNKQKDAEEAPPITLKAKVKDLGVVDNKLRPITSLVLKQVDARTVVTEERTINLEER